MTTSLISEIVLPCLATCIILSSAQDKLTAVGLVSKSIFFAFSRSDYKSSLVFDVLCNAASAIPNAPDTPIAGAPRTTKVLMALATSL